MSSNFLQRFKGKTQLISKNGVHNILGGNTGQDAYIYTHSNGLPNNKKLNSTQTNNVNLSKNKTQQINSKTDSQSKNSKSTNSFSTHTQKLRAQQKQQQKKKQTQQNPFLISNPFYLDQQQRRKQQEQELQNKRFQLEKQKRDIQNSKDQKKGIYSSLNEKRESLSKKTQKQWTKLGGLGPNVGGQQWEQKRKKHQKMQQFANQVKVINTQKGNVAPKAIQKRQQKKQDPRTKALEYSKKVPKPVIKSYEKQQKNDEFQQSPMQQINQNQMSQLQIYELRHKQLKQMLKNQL